MHLRAAAHDSFEPELLVEPAIELGRLTDQPEPFGGFVHGRPQFVNVERFGQIGVGPVLHGGDGRIDRTVAGQQNYLGVGQLFFRLAQNCQAVDVGHPQVGNDDVECVAFDERGPADARVGHRTLVSSQALQAVGHGLGMGFVVVDNQDTHRRTGVIQGFFGRGSHDTGGSEMVKRVPRDGSLATVILPPWASIIRLTVASPSPLPEGFVE